jgi:hypothetical protein
MRDWQAKLWCNVLLGVLNEGFPGQLTAQQVRELQSLTPKRVFLGKEGPNSRLPISLEKSGTRALGEFPGEEGWCA